MNFTKMHGAGNDFVVVDGRHECVNWQDAAWMASLADRRMGIGCEGFLILLPAEAPEAAFRLVFLNPDGHEAELCGNGTRCAALYGYCHGFTHAAQFRISTGAGLVEAEVLCANARDGNVRIRLQPATQPEERKVSLEGRDVPCIFVNSGVPHAVVFVEDVESVDVEKHGRALRYDPAFAPAGTNVDFVQRIGQSAFRMRTYERGVEAESGACGTGAVAVAIAASVAYPDVIAPVQLFVQSGAVLEVDAREVAGPTLTGPACEVFSGEVPL